MAHRIRSPTSPTRQSHKVSNLANTAKIAHAAAPNTQFTSTETGQISMHAAPLHGTQAPTCRHNGAQSPHLNGPTLFAARQAPHLRDCASTRLIVPPKPNLPSVRTATSNNLAYCHSTGQPAVPALAPSGHWVECLSLSLFCAQLHPVHRPASFPNTPNFAWEPASTHAPGRSPKDRTAPTDKKP